MSRDFASQSDLQDKEVTFTALGGGGYAYTAQGDPNTGVVMGDGAVMVIDTQATPLMAQDVIARIRTVTEAPIRCVVLTHYHAVRVLGAAAYGAEHVIASQDTRDLIAERGAQDYASEVSRFPRLFRAVESIPGLTWPNVTFRGEMRVWLGRTEARLMQLGRGHTRGDAIVWLPESEVLFSGDLVESGATPYAGDAYLAEWPQTLARLAALKPRALVPGRGDALVGHDRCRLAIEQTREFVSELSASVRAGRVSGRPLKDIYRDTCDRLRPRFGAFAIFDHCMPFDVSRAWDEAGGVAEPRIWTAERDRQMWEALEG
ncbi:MAG TPA: MBL fold metallo-hydrolase [Steroidobacteraceae bacterium]|nr:MBL fold metallo-hydrolase [Steroidobacteraceae bacterium]